MGNDDALAERLRESIGRLVRVTRAHADSLPPPHSALLGLLGREGDMTIAALAQRRGVRHQSASRTVMELLAAGHVGRHPDPGDRRALLVALTDAGREALDRDRRARRDGMARAIARALTPDERARLATVPDLLDKLAAHTADEQE
ncbi:MarR family transcriptional regulator [Streptomyces sp. SL13]|uniref:MarR family transcriptional regulator n=1 Tax=Streptantibioticus silvisoli TaxID=2705255 RepID=A0AA90H880_9ACTN|nr:MarR family transcriptional regulator [Streptantibioticus silvisoli]MDI5972319.1 MarR family transcriptional regulator [Streptantibioticus silvisoli]